MAKIGSLTADLSLEAAAFIRDLKKAADATSANTARMSKSMTAMQTGFASAGRSIRNSILAFASIAGARALVSLGTNAIQAADEVAAAARKIGVSAEELQRWNVAAEQADVNVTELETAFKMFQRNLAAGKIKAEGDNMTEAFANFVRTVAEAPTQLEKTRLAVAAGGRNAQTILLLAASGAKVFGDQLKNAFVISNDLVAVGDQLDDEWARVTNAISAGFATGFLEAFQNQLGVTQGKLASFNVQAQAFGNAIGSAFSMALTIASKFVQVLANAREGWRLFLTDVGVIGGEGPGSSFAKNVMPGTPGAFRGAADAFPGLGVGADPKAAATAARDAAAAQAEWNKTMQEGMQVWEQSLGPMGTYNNEINRLTSLYEKGAISAETFGIAQRMAAASAVAPWLQVAGTVAGALGELFGENKAVAIAQAIINTAQGITAALAQYPPPLSFAMAAAVAAAGAAQIATIASTKPGGGTKTPSVTKSGGGGGRRGGAEETVGSGSLQQTITLNIQGDVFGPEHFRKMVKGINGVVADGTVLLRTT